jgi:hypothetical protein
VEVKEQHSALQELEDAFADIQQGTSIRTIDEMVVAFTEAEDASFSLVTMINEANREIEAEDVEVGRIQEQMATLIANAKDPGLASLLEAISQGFGDEFEEQNAGNHSSSRADLVIEELQEKSVLFDKEFDNAVRLLDRIKPAVHSLFQKVGAADEAAMESLAATGVSDSNILLFLGVVEARVAEIVAMQRSLGIAAPPLPVSSFSPRAAASVAQLGVSTAPQQPGLGRQPAMSSPAIQKHPPMTAGAVLGSRNAGLPPQPALRKPEPPSMMDHRKGVPIMPVTANGPASGRTAVSSGGPRASRARLTAQTSAPRVGTARVHTASHRPHAVSSSALTRPVDPDGVLAGPSGGSHQPEPGEASLGESEDDDEDAIAGPSYRAGSSLKDSVLDISDLKRRLGLAPRTIV